MSPLTKSIEGIQKLFSSCTGIEEKYQKIIDLGRSQKALPLEQKCEENRVLGCQSTMYLHTHFDGKLLYFACEADAIISAGLGLLLTSVYSGNTPETILKHPPTYVQELGIPQALTPGRANGLASLYIRMKQEALKYYGSA